MKKRLRQIVWFGFIPTLVWGVPALHSISDIRQLGVQTAGQHIPVELEAQVIRIHNDNGLFLFDGEKGVFGGITNDKSLLGAVSLGDWVRVQGHTIAGGFAPSIRMQSLEVIDHRPLPEARVFDSAELARPSTDCDWVAVSGRLISMKPVKIITPMILLELEQDNVRYFIQMNDTPENRANLTGKMFKQLTFNAVAGTRYNKQRQAVGRVFFVNAADDLHPTDELRPQADPIPVPIHALMRLGFDPDCPVIIRGMVTSIADQQITLRGEGCSVLAAVLPNLDMQVGDQVLLEGYGQQQSISPAFRAYRCDVTKQANRPIPKPMELTQELHSGYQMELVRLDAEVIGLDRALEGAMHHTPDILICRSGDTFFEARMPIGHRCPSEMTPGSMIRLTGICHLIQNEDEHWRVLADRFFIQLRGTEDLMLLSAAPWWNPARLLGLVSTVVGFAFFCLLWIVLLRKTVRHQTRVISEQVAQATITDERQRIARELHDTLNQGLVGAALQMRSGKRLLELNQPEACGQTIDLARQMLEHCSNETRNTIIDLRGGMLAQMSLPEVLERELNRLECQAVVLFSSKGECCCLKQEAERNVLLIAREAVTNAIRHGAPKEIIVTLSYQPDHLALTIRDDGCGFDSQISATATRFGIQGMMERAKRLGGKLDLQSVPHEGTQVAFNLPKLEKWKR